MTAGEALRAAIDEGMALVVFKKKNGELAIGYIDSDAIEDAADAHDEDGQPEWTSVIVSMAVTRWPEDLAGAAMDSATKGLVQSLCE